VQGDAAILTGTVHVSTTAASLLGSTFKTTADKASFLWMLRRPVEYGHFRSKKYVRAFGDVDLLGSMGRVGACTDNAAMQSFFALLQKNVLNQRRWAPREQLRLAIITWIEGCYHRKRRQRRLGKLTPVEYEAMIIP